MNGVSFYLNSILAPSLRKHGVAEEYILNMIHIWDAVEADFLRDYRIWLVDQLEHMTWRQFLVLLNNLSPYGAVHLPWR